MFAVDCLIFGILSCNFDLLKIKGRLLVFSGRIKTSVVKQERQGQYLTCLQKILGTIYSLDKLSHAEVDTVGASQ